MIETVAIVVCVLLAIAAADVVGPRIRLAAPILLVTLGVVVSLLPFTPTVVIDPEIILDGLLPPLLYASAVAMPAMTFRREVGPIASLAVPLVVVTALVSGLVLAALIPDLGFSWAVALGAIISPTDAVATSLIRGGRVPRRVVRILEGESLLNDATALVLLRTAVAASVVGFSFWGSVGTFLYSVAVAAGIGAFVGWAALRVWRRIPGPTVNTIVSFTVPFLAAVPTELLGGSGLVAAVVAGLVTGFMAPRVLPPRHRLSDAGNWATVNVVLEGVVFLTMGLQIADILNRVHVETIGLGPATGIAVVALLAVLLVRVAYTVPLLWSVARRARRGQAVQSRVAAVRERASNGDMPAAGAFVRISRRSIRPGWEKRVRERWRVMLADVDYFVAHPLGPREGAMVVWAGMRGAVTVAAVQTLPAEAPHRPLLVFVAFTVAVLSLLLQGTTIQPVANLLYRGAEKPAEEGAEPEQQSDRTRVADVLSRTADGVPRAAGTDDDHHRLAVLIAQRNALLDERDRGTTDADVLSAVLRAVDAEQIALELRLEPAN